MMEIEEAAVLLLRILRRFGYLELFAADGESLFAVLKAMCIDIQERPTGRERFPIMKRIGYPRDYDRPQFASIHGTETEAELARIARSLGLLNLLQSPWEDLEFASILDDPWRIAESR